MGIFGLILTGILAAILALCAYFAWILRQRTAYFKKQGMPYMGNCFKLNWKTITGELNLIEFEEIIYKQAKTYNAPLVAMSDFTGQTTVICTDPDLIKRIMVKDADHFVNQRPIKTQKSSKYFTKMLFVMRNEQWKALRAKMTPAFTTGKIKRMYQMFSTSSQRMDTYIKEQINYPQTKSMDVNFFQLLFKYSIDIIANVAFCIDSKGWETKMDEFSTFEQYSKNFEFKFGATVIFKFLLMVAAPKIADLLELEILDDKAQTYFANIVREVLKRRRQTGERRDDFLQLMIDIQQGILKVDEIDNELKNDFGAVADKFVFDDEYLIANALMFFLGGFDTTQTVLLFTVYSLALEPEVQEKLHKEVKSVMEKNGGKITYDSLFDMPYLDTVIQETMRIYPAASRTERECTTDYFVEETGFKIEKGTVLSIPIHGIHHDPKYYPNPEKFIPERFSPENKATRHQYTYLPFGYGPRSCIGMRFALLKVKAVIAQIVSSYKLAPCDKSPIPLKYDGNASARPVGGMWLNVAVRE